ncbi:hypothetical protein GCM10027446_22610 [Angustibacter peucedani]
MPWELVGWGAFACLVGAVAVVVFGGSWGVAALVLAAGVLGIGAVAAMAVTGSSRPRRPPSP